MNRTYLIAAMLLILTIGAASTVYLWREPQVVVISSGPEEQQVMLESLLAANDIVYGKNDEQRVTVAESELMRVRRLAAERGIITPPRDGLETFRDDNYGATEFVQRVNYQRALQAEIERTIIKLDGILDARVHMRQPQRSTFFRKEEETRASILVKLEEGVELAALAPSIAQIAAGAVEGLEAASVNIVADNGTMSAGSTAAGLGNGPSGRQQASLEAHYRDAIRTVLTPMYPGEELSITVTVELDFRKRSYRRENVPIKASRVTTRSTVSPMDGSAAGEGRVDEYSFGVESESVETPAGAISRIGIGVMIADRLTSAEIEDIEELIAAATGISYERGDTIKVISHGGAPADGSELQTADTSIPTGEVAEPAPPPVATRAASAAPVVGLAALLDPRGVDLLLVAVGLLGGLLLVVVLTVGRQLSRRRMTRDVLAWVEDAQ